MEHLPDVTNPSPLVPLLIEALPGRLEAEQFLIKEGFDWGEDSVFAAVQAQKYLYFGLISCFTDCKLDLNLYIHDDKAYLNSYFNRYALGTRWFRLRSFDVVFVLLRTVNSQVTALLAQFPLSQGLDHAHTEYKHREIHLVCLSIRLLLEHLQLELCYRLWLSYTSSEQNLPDLSFSDLRTTAQWHTIFAISAPMQYGEVFRKLLFRGWCPSSIEVILTDLSWSTCTYLSTIQTPGVAHIESTIPPKHMQNDVELFDCTADRCLYTIDETTYQTRHTENRCACRFVQIPDDVWDIVGRGGIALVRFIVDEDAPSYLKVEEAKHDSIYFAVSHVWSGGLGNQNANALPLCQLQKLVGIFTNVSRQLRLKDQSPLFWMDTLCIPTRKSAGYDIAQIQASKLVRRRAVDNILSIYTHATATIVIDPSLQQLADDASLNRIHAQILASSWRSRCWTFEEASLSSEIFIALKSRVCRVQVSDGPPHIQCGNWSHTKQRRDKIQIPSGPLQNHPRSIQELVRGELMSWVHDLPRVGSGTDTSFRDPPILHGRLSMSEQNPYYFCDIYNAVLRRATSHETDRFIILSTMLNFRPSDVTKIPADSRLVSIVASLQYLPEELLFMDHEPGSSPNRPKSWMPTKFMCQPIKMVFDFRWLTKVTRAQGRAWQLHLSRDEKQCMFVLSRQHLTSVNVKVKVEDSAYSLTLVYPDHHQTAVDPSPSVKSRSWPGDEDDQTYILLLRDAKAIQETRVDQPIRGVLFRHPTQRSLESSITYLTPVQCSLKLLESAESALPNTLDIYETIRLDLADPNCKHETRLQKSRQKSTNTISPSSISTINAISLPFRATTCLHHGSL